MSMFSGYSSSVSDSCFLPRFSSNVVLASRKLSMVFNLHYLRRRALGS